MGYGLRCYARSHNGEVTKPAHLFPWIFVMILVISFFLSGCDGGNSGGSATFENDVVLDVQYIRNYGGTCVASSFAMALNYFEPNAEISKVFNIFGVPPFDNNEYGNFNDWITNEFDLEMRHYPDRTIDDVISCIDEDYPAIVHQQDSLGLAEGHMRVVIGYNFEKEYFIIHDPSNRGAFYRESFSIFEILWELITNIEPVPANQIFLLAPIGENSPLD